MSYEELLAAIKNKAYTTEEGDKVISTSTLQALLERFLESQREMARRLY